MFVCLSRKTQSLELCMGTNKGVQGLSPVRECVWPGLKLGLGHTGGGGLTKEGVPVEVCCDLCKGRRDNVETQINTIFGLEAPGAGQGRAPQSPLSQDTGLAEGPELGQRHGETAMEEIPYLGLCCKQGMSNFPK